MPHAANTALPLPDASPGGLGWLLLLPIAVLIVVQMVFTAATGGFDLAALGGPDPYMHLVRVQALEGGGTWFDSRELRIGPPDGHVQHWTRPFDLLLWLGGRALAPLLGFDAALHLFAQLLSPLILIVAVVTLDWASAPLLDQRARFLACLVLLLQPAVLAYCGLGRADHHSLLLLLSLVMLGLVVRAISPADEADRRPALLAGAVGGLALWISTETLVFIGAFMVALALPWLTGERRLLRASRDLVLATTATLAVALVVERGGHDPLAVEPDRISVVHVVLFALITGFWSLAGRLRWVDGMRWPGRIGLGAGGAACVALLLALLFPDLRHGILGEVDPLYRELRLERIVEIQPPLRLAWLQEGEPGLFLNRLLFWFGLAFVALPLLARRLARGPADARRRWLPVAVALAVMLPLTLHQWRWAIYTQSLLVVPYAAAVGLLLEQLGRRLGGAWLAAVRPPAMLLSLFWVPAAAMALPNPAPIETASGACPLAELAPVLNRLDQRPRTIMTMADLGPELLYRTHHRVLSIPNHRPQPGFRATAEVLASADPERARRIARASGVDWILLCGTGPEVEFARGAGDARGTSLYARLRDGTPPPWLRAVPLGGVGAPGVRLFERVEAGAPAR